MADNEPIKQSAWLAKSNFNFAKKNKASIVFPTVVHLSSNTIFKIMSTSFEPLSRDSHYISVAARMILADRVSGKIYREEEVFGAETQMSAQFERVNDFLDRRINQAKQKMELAGYDMQSFRQRTVAYEAECTSRQASDFIALLKKADVYLGLIEFMWMARELSDKQDEAIKAKIDNEREVKTQILSIPRKSTQQFQVIHRICKEVMEQRKQESAAQSARDKKKHAEMSKPQHVAAAQAEQNAIAAMPMSPEAVLGALAA